MKYDPIYSRGKALAIECPLGLFSVCTFIYAYVYAYICAWIPFHVRTYRLTLSSLIAVLFFI